MTPSQLVLQSGALEQEARAIFRAMTVAPNGPRQQLISRTVRALKAAGLWALIDALYLTAAHDSQAALVNWKNPGTWSLVGTNSPTFTVDRGYQGDGTSSYLLASGYNPSSAGGNFSLNSGVFGGWIQQVSTTSGGVDIGLTSTSRIGVNSAATGYSTRLNDATTLLSSPLSITATHWAGRRLSSGGKDLWRAGAQYNTVDSSASTSVGTALVIGAQATTTGYSNGRVAAAYVAGALTDAQMVAMHAALLAYMQGVGVA